MRLVYFLLLLCSTVASYALLSLGASFYCEGFRPGALSTILPLKTIQLPPDLPCILQQPYYYLGKGSQAYVFESEDGKWIIKLFRMNRFRTTTFPHLPAFLEKIQAERVRQKNSQQTELLNSCQLANTTLKEQCAAYFAHLTRTHNLGSILVHDKLGRPYKIDCNHTPFLVQRKAVPLYDYLLPLIQRKDYLALERALNALCDLLLTRFEKGVADYDPAIEKNIGFLEDSPIFLDVGQFYLNHSIKDPAVIAVEGEIITSQLRHWLAQRLPQEVHPILSRLKF